jgi:hypothetical protein
MDESEAKTTTDHEQIRQWAEERGGRPAMVKGTGKGGKALLRIDFGEPEESLEEISWEDFFDSFEKANLAFLHQDRTKDGQMSRFFKFVAR